jgi:hypothetical protein
MGRVTGTSMPSLPPRGAAASRRATLLLYGGACLLIVGVHLATNGVLGFHIDELYYLACGRHLAFGYVDFPPLVPLIARLETTVNRGPSDLDMSTLGRWLASPHA